MTIGGPPEFKERYQGLPGLKDKYGLTFKSFASLDTAGPITVKALADGSVQVATLFTTDPNIASRGFKVLADPEQVFTAQNVTPLAYRDSMTPVATATLNAVSAKLDTPALAAMMTQIMNQKRDIDVVADDWLKKAGVALRPYSGHQPSHLPTPPETRPSTSRTPLPPPQPRVAPSPHVRSAARLVRPPGRSAARGVLHVYRGRPALVPHPGPRSRHVLGPADA